MTVSLDPTFFVIGAGRCGTTALSEMLRQHPDVFVTSPKEPNFLALEGTTPAFEGPGDESTANRYSVTELGAYRELYLPANGAHARGDASVSSLFYAPKALSTLERLFPDARVVVCLREPVARAYSAYSLMRNRGFEPCSRFIDAIELEQRGARRNWRPIWHYVEMGCYAQQLEPYVERLGPDRVLIVFHDHLVADPLDVARKVFRHLGVNEHVDVSPDRVNTSGAARSAALQHAIHWAARRPRLRAAVRSALPYRSRERLKRLNIRGVGVPDDAVGRLAAVYGPDLARLRELLIGHYGQDAHALPKWLA